MGTEVRYAETAGGSRIAYTVGGDDPTTVVIGQATLAVEPADQRLGWVSCTRYARKVEYDHAGSGLSATAAADYSFDGIYDELRAICDAASPNQSVVLLGSYGSGPAAIRYAAEHPERVHRLVLHNCWARATDYYGQPGWSDYRDLLAGDWHTAMDIAARIAAGWTGEAARQRATTLRSAVNQERLLAYYDGIAEHDATDFLAKVNVPTCVVYNPNMTFALDHIAKELAARIHGATLSVAPPFPSGVGDSALFERAARRWILGDEDSARPGEDEMTQQRPPDSAGLSDRELEVLGLVAQGLTNIEVAAHLSLQPSTVSRHVHHVLQKTQCRNRVELTGYAHRFGLAEPQ